MANSFTQTDRHTWYGRDALSAYFVEATDGGHKDQSDRLAVFWQGHALSYQIGCAATLGDAAKMAWDDKAQKAQRERADG